MSKLFGTDGIRGVANRYPITPEMALNIGRAVAYIFKKNKDVSKIVVGKDTRISGYMLEYAIVSGICSIGVNVHLAGVLPTPAVAFLTSSTGADAGIMISASHNPFFDNGIKIFNDKGYKLSDEKEAEIERAVLGDKIASVSRSVRETGKVHDIGDEGKRCYSDFLMSTLQDGRSFKGMKVVIDCANGATCGVVPSLFTNLKADFELIFSNPDGKNINENCGSQHPKTLIKKVLEKGADVGLAFDGDGDRLVAVDEKGNVLTGDQILAVCAKVMKQNGTLKNSLVVSTTMSNMGLGIALKNMGIKHVVTRVGDRYVLKKMVSIGAVLGGEDSGHMIFLDHHTTGDGILTALKLIGAIRSQKKPLSELSKVITVFPQVLINIKVKRKPDIKTIQAITDRVKMVEADLGRHGRVFVRYSGTEPLCRIMVEGPTADKTSRYCRQIADAVQKELG